MVGDVLEESTASVFYVATLKMEVVLSSKTSVTIHQTTRHHNPIFSNFSIQTSHLIRIQIRTWIAVVNEYFFSFLAGNRLLEPAQTDAASDS
jgi:hypothetical protein